MYKLLLRPLLFLFDAEKVHYTIFFLIKYGFRIPGIAKLTRSLYRVEDPRLERQLFGLTFKNPVGLAAGFDKNAVLYNDLFHFGFGFIEVGTVTPKAQPGNPKKRLFRIQTDEGIINRMGLNNKGLQQIISELKTNKQQLIIGGNIGKNTSTSPENYTNDYVTCFSELHPYVDYFVLNVSCPNVKSSEKLSNVDYLKTLIIDIQNINNTCLKQKPILLKISPDLNDSQLDDIIKLIQDTKLDGVIASNTTTNRDDLKTSEKTLKNIGHGGLSGQPLKDKSTRTISYLHKKSNGSFPIIGVGGIHSSKDALEKIHAGASLVQIYTGFIYEGPSLVKSINKLLLQNS